jgi:uncharacterized protein
VNGRDKVKRFIWIAALAAAALPAPAVAQASDIETFISAVRDRDGGKATGILRARGTTVLNSRNLRGETALLVAVSARDELWTQFLLAEGANPNLAARDGETPLIAAARIGFADAVDWLLASGAKVDGTNRMGETALIVAVQQRHGSIVKTLLEQGANPDKPDSAAGYTARDYAKRDGRARDILALIDASKPKSQKLEDFKLE